ncbi:MAG: hydroxymethylglutaryl-CoA lyase [Deltaproteobacteria bacterium]|nr:hydroxymethylglutaryl-CoA lyase [Deltaproteobacteria bacterium]
MKTGHDVAIIEVGPRDGLQNVAAFVETAQKVSLIRRLAASGLKEIQAGAFVSPRAIPQFRDMKEVVAGIIALPKVRFSALVPNLQGAREAVKSGIEKLIFFFSLSESHNLNNVRQTKEASLKGLEVIQKNLAAEAPVELCVALATVFGCPFEGYMTTDQILKDIEKIANMGIKEITLCDTVGFGNPRQVEEVTVACLKDFPEITFAVHFHNTRGLGLANALRAYDVGIRRFDAAVGGLGGCPFAPGASGNIATEDLVFMFNEMGIPTGIDMDSLLNVSSYLKEILPGVILSSAVYQAGLPKTQTSGPECGTPNGNPPFPAHQEW